MLFLAFISFKMWSSLKSALLKVCLYVGFARDRFFLLKDR